MRRRAPSQRTTPSGRFLMRLPGPLHASLRAAALSERLSLNEYCVRLLAAGSAGQSASKDAAAVVAHAGRIAHASLLGVVLYGSWTRGEATASSDVDTLIVVERALPLNRSLYRAWDASPPTWQGRTVDPHFAHPPSEPLTGGLWPEIAIDGIVLFEQGWNLSTQLVRIRREIADGRLVRRTVHGQPYWSKGAA